MLPQNPGNQRFLLVVETYRGRQRFVLIVQTYPVTWTHLLEVYTLTCIKTHSPIVSCVSPTKVVVFVEEIHWRIFSETDVGGRAKVWLSLVRIEAKVVWASR